MPRPKLISIPLERPATCAECPLLGKRPLTEIPKGDRYTLRCFLPQHERLISGRGSKQPAARNRCKLKEYNKAFATYAGDIPVSPTDYVRYQLDKFSWLFERDKNSSLTKPSQREG